MKNVKCECFYVLLLRLIVPVLVVGLYFDANVVQ